ncbi:invasion associated locus B family protein [Camelimonas sp. ID_303_24]
MTSAKAWVASITVALAFAALSASGVAAAGPVRKPATAEAPFEASPGYDIRPSDVVVPDNVPIGQYRRVIRPFQYWTLICDENIAKKKRVCNITQTVARSDKTVAFSWSLAASENGKPFFILRMPQDMEAGQPVLLDISDGGAPVSVPVKGCNGSVCIGYLQIGPRVRAAINKGNVVQVSYRQGAGVTQFRAPLRGLAQALSGI